MTSAAYYVDGVPLVNTGGELCEACGVRKAVGHSPSMHLVCARCAGMAATLADEYAQEVDAARERREAKHRAAMARIRRFNERKAAEQSTVSVNTLTLHKRGRRRTGATHFKCGHAKSPENTYTHPRTEWTSCRVCHNEARRKNREKGSLPSGFDPCLPAS